MLTDERKATLEAAYQANIAAGRGPYAGVAIRNNDELTWIYDQRSWSGRWWREKGKSRAELRGAVLTDADLTDADLTDADLSDANLSRANLSRADLSDADLSRADLSRADLSRANLSDANLSDADLSRADLSRADLTDADLTDADLRSIRADIYDVVLHAPLDLPYLITALEQGKVNGSTYRDDCEFGCLVGTLEIGAEKRTHQQLDLTLPRDANRPAEQWFFAIRLGMTPENSQIVKITHGWLKELDNTFTLIGAAYSAQKPATTQVFPQSIQAV